MVSGRRQFAAAIGLFLLAVAAACQPAVSPDPVGPSGRLPSAPARPASPPPVGEVDLLDTAYAPEDGVPGGQIVLGDWQEAQQFNPFYVGQVTEANVASAAWATLVVVTHDSKYAPDLAVNVPTLDNGGVAVPGAAGDAMTVTWRLKPDLRWSDGEPLTCDDFRYAWEWVLHPDNVVITAGWSDIGDWECRSDTEMVLHFDAVFEGYISLVLAPLPRHYLEAFPVADQTTGAGFRTEEMAHVPTSGAFSIESVTPSQELRLVRNPHYRGFARNASAYLDAIVVKWYGDPGAMIAGYRGGEIDIATELHDAEVPMVQNLGDRVKVTPALTYEFLRPNWADGQTVGGDGVGGCSRNPAVQDRGDGCPMADPAVRLAIAHAIDKERIRTQLLGGTVQVANTNVTPDAWFYADQRPTAYDPAQARSILEDAGWADLDGDGVREKGGLRAKIELCTNTSPMRIDALALVSSWLAEVGIETVTNPVDNNSIFASYSASTRDTPCALGRSNFDLAMHFFSSSINPLDSYFSYHSTQFEPVGANEAQIDDPDIDRALDAVKNSVDFEIIRNAMAEFQRVYVAQTVEIPLFFVNNVDLVSRRVGNFVPNPTSAGPTWNAVDWYLKP